VSAKQKQKPPDTFGVGSKVWVFDLNHRVYADKKIAKGQLWYSGAPIWREHWVPKVITGETSRSWLVSTYEGDRFPTKLSKAELANGTLHGVLTSQADVDAACYVNKHAFSIAERVQRLPTIGPGAGVKTAEVLKQIAVLVGYEPALQGEEKP
jgi:hypothetical protein